MKRSTNVIVSNLSRDNILFSKFIQVCFYFLGKKTGGGARPPPPGPSPCYGTVLAGAHHQESATTPYSCHGVFTDQSIFSLNLSRIQIPTGTSVTNCNHKHGLMLTCRHVHVRLHCFKLTEACSGTLELAYFARKNS